MWNANPDRRKLSSPPEALTVQLATWIGMGQAGETNDFKLQVAKGSGPSAHNTAEATLASRKALTVMSHECLLFILVSLTEREIRCDRAFSAGWAEGPREYITHNQIIDLD